MADTQFKDFYKRECHICKTTMEVAARFSAMEDDLDPVLKKLGISQNMFHNLRNGDHCDPDMVARLCEYLGMDGGLLKTCPRKGDFLNDKEK